LLQEKVHAYFSLLKQGNNEAISIDNLRNDINTLSNPDNASSWVSSYDDYMSNYASNCASVSHGYKYTINWTVGAGSAWSLED
jgi:hypothetical protein